MLAVKSAVRLVFERISGVSPQAARLLVSLCRWNSRLYIGAARASNLKDDLSCNVKRGELQGYRFERLFDEEFVPLLRDKMEPTCSRLLRLLNPQDKIAIDVGASYGYYAVLLSDIVGEAGKVYSFEPDIQSFTRLVHNLKINNLRNVIPLPYAVADNCQVMSWHSDVNQPWLGHYTERKSSTAIGSEAIVPIITLSLDSLETILPFSQIALLKIDVEGQEAAVLRGAAQLLSHHRPRALIELHSTEVTEEVFQILSSHRYQWETVEYFNETRHHILAYPKESSEITHAILDALHS